MDHVEPMNNFYWFQCYSHSLPATTSTRRNNDNDNNSNEDNISDNNSSSNGKDEIRFDHDRKGNKCRERITVFSWCHKKPEYEQAGNQLTSEMANRKHIQGGRK